MTHAPRSRSIHFFGFAFFLLLSLTATSLSAAPGASKLATFKELSELKDLTEPAVALQLGDAGGIWIKKLGSRSDNGGTIAELDEAYHWARQCDPGRLDARWFGVVADGITDDAAALQAAIDASWLSECGNGVQLDGCVYKIISNTCFADNDGAGVVINGGQGTEISGSVFVRNKHGLTINKAIWIRVIGGVFGTDGAGGPRDDKEFIYSSNSREVIIQGTSFSSAENSIPAAVLYQGPKPLVEGCTYSGNVGQLTAEK